jgi:hypothetical protein
MTDKPERQTAQVMFTVDGTKHIVAARSDQDSADSHAVNGDLLEWANYNELMNLVSDNKEGSK